MSFSPYVRCLKMEQQNLTDEEKASMWWQKSDYEDFARVSRIISKAMLEGGSEVWLRSNSPLGSETDCKTKGTSPTKSMDDTLIESLSSTALNPPLHHDFILESNSEKYYEMRDKWWHKFGHSRRGLEHIASHAEGRQRLLNGRSAIRSIMEEQQRQNMFLPAGYYDVDKFRTVYLKETLWARILARAAGESDADAVQSGFDEPRRKPREYYVKKHFDNNPDYYTSRGNKANIPIFMKSSISQKRFIEKINLDANTVSQICFRNSQGKPLSNEQQDKKKRGEARVKTKSPTVFDGLELSARNEEKKVDVSNDGDASTSIKPKEDTSSSLAKMAAGWGVDETQEDMSSVLIGMGITVTPNITIG